MNIYGHLLDVNSHILFSPLQCKVPLPGFEGLQFCVSQYEEKHRELLRNLCHVLEGKLVNKFTKKVNLNGGYKQLQLNVFGIVLSRFATQTLFFCCIWISRTCVLSFVIYLHNSLLVAISIFLRIVDLGCIVSQTSDYVK